MRKVSATSNFPRAPKRLASAEVLERRLMLAAQLVKDINTQPSNDWPPLSLTAAGSVIYYDQHDGADGDELWRTDGTVAGTKLVKDIYPGLGSSLPSGFTTIGNITFFDANDGTTGNELWRTDGTVNGTFEVKDINPGINNSAPSTLTADGSILYFFADDGVHGRELWRSDGTAAGTVMVDDIDPGSAGQSFPTTARIGVTNDGTLYFIAFNGTNSALYKSDGTVGNLTLILASPTSGDGFNSNDSMIASGTRIYFEDIAGFIWTSDGTKSGTVTIDTQNANANGFTNVNGTIFYTHGTSVKEINGTTVTTVSGGFSIDNGNPAYYTNVGGTLFFFSNGVTGTGELWKVPPASLSASLIENNVEIDGMANVSGTLFFDAGSATAGYTIWKSNGSVAGTTPVKLVYSNSSTALTPNDLTGIGSTLVFVNSDNTAGSELWVSDGTSTGTHLLADIYPGTASASPFLWSQPLGNKLLFNATDGLTGTELWITDGTAAGTIQLKDINPGASSSSVSNLRVIGNLAFFSASDPTDGAEPWVTDGTPANTYRIADINPGTGSSSPTEFTGLNGWIYFAATDSTHGTELWRTTGAAGSAQLVADINAGSASSSPNSLVAMNGFVYFIATTSANGAELWRTDGTTTQIVKDIFPGATGASIGNLTAINGMLYFAAESDTNSGIQPWESNGTVTGMIKRISTISSHNSSPASFTLYNNAVYFAATDDTAGRELWVTDGTSNGTTRVADIDPGSASSSPSNFNVMNGKLYFLATDGIDAGHIWSTLGTAATTTLVTPSIPDSVMNMTAIGGHLFMIADDVPDLGFELWTSDGTVGGTGIVQDLAPGFIQGTSGKPVGINGDVYLAGNDTISGTEVYRFPDIYSPTIWNMSASATVGAHVVSFSFSENVSASLSAADLELQKQVGSTWQPVDSSTTQLTYDPATNIGTFTLPETVMTDGRYRAIILAGSVSDIAGNTLATDASFDFAYIGGSTGNDFVNVQLASDGTDVQFNDVEGAGGPTSFATPLSGLTSILVQTGSGDDTLTVSMAAGNPIPSGGLSFDGGTGTNAFDLVGTSGNHMVGVGPSAATFDAANIAYANTQNFIVDPAAGSDSLSVSGTTVSVPAAIRGGGIVSDSFPNIVINSGGVLKVPSALNGGSSLDHTDRIVINTNSLNDSGQLDLGDNDMIVHGGSLPAVNGLLAQGFNQTGGYWNGNGIDSSAAANSTGAALGVEANNDGSGHALTTSFDAQNVGVNDLLIKFTYFGDANLDGVVNGDDYTLIDNGFNERLSGWRNGDFNYDGSINGADYLLIDSAFNLNGAPLAVAAAMPPATLESPAKFTAKLSAITDASSSVSCVAVSPAGYGTKADSSSNQKHRSIWTTDFESDELPVHVFF